MRTPLALEGLFDHIEALVGASEDNDVVGRPWNDWLSPSDEISLQVKKLSWVLDERPDYTLPLLSKFDHLATMLALLRKYTTMMPEPLLLPSSLDALASVAQVYNHPHFLSLSLSLSLSRSAWGGGGGAGEGGGNSGWR